MRLVRRLITKKLSSFDSSVVTLTKRLYCLYLIITYIVQTTDSSKGTRTKFYPNQPKARVSFSLAHQICQTLFSDLILTIQNRTKKSMVNSSGCARKFLAMVYEEQQHRKRPLCKNTQRPSTNQSSC